MATNLTKNRVILPLLLLVSRGETFLVLVLQLPPTASRQVQHVTRGRMNRKTSPKHSVLDIIMLCSGWEMLSVILFLEESSVMSSFLYNNLKNTISNTISTHFTFWVRGGLNRWLCGSEKSPKLAKNAMKLLYPSWTLRGGVWWNLSGGRTSKVFQVFSNFS